MRCWRTHRLPHPLSDPPPAGWGAVLGRPAHSRRLAQGAGSWGPASGAAREPAPAVR